MSRCSVGNCSSRVYSDTGKSFHLFPIDEPDRLKAWVTAMSQRSFVPGRVSLLCSDHFEESCFDRSRARPRLVENAVPSIFKAHPASTPAKRNVRGSAVNLSDDSVVHQIQPDGLVSTKAQPVSFSTAPTKNVTAEISMTKDASDGEPVIMHLSYSCTMCGGQSFKFKHDLELHKLIFHCHRCYTCSQNFSSLACLDNHKKTYDCNRASQESGAGDNDRTVDQSLVILSGPKIISFSPLEPTDFDFGMGEEACNIQQTTGQAIDKPIILPLVRHIASKSQTQPVNSMSSTREPDVKETETLSVQRSNVDFLPSVHCEQSRSWPTQRNESVFAMYHKFKNVPSLFSTDPPRCAKSRDDIQRTSYCVMPGSPMKETNIFVNTQLKVVGCIPQRAVTGQSFCDIQASTAVLPALQQGHDAALQNVTSVSHVASVQSTCDKLKSLVYTNSIGLGTVAAYPKSCRQRSDITAQTYACEQCGVIFSSQLSLISHKRSHAAVSKWLITIKSYTCTACKQTFKCSATDFVKHQKSLCAFELPLSRNKPTSNCPAFKPLQRDVWFPCKSCYHTFPSYARLMAHKYGCHHFVCSDCDENFHDISFLLRHKQQYHSSQPPQLQLYACHDCNQSLKCQTDFDTHATARTKMLYVCTLCSMKFITACDLEIHKKRHAFCNSATTVKATSVEAFYNYASLNNKVLAKNFPAGLQWKDVHICDICSEVFDFVFKLVEHQRISPCRGLLEQCEASWIEKSRHLEVQLSVQNKSTVQIASLDTHCITSMPKADRDLLQKQVNPEALLAFIQKRTAECLTSTMKTGYSSITESKIVEDVYSIMSDEDEDAILPLSFQESSYHLATDSNLRGGIGDTSLTMKCSNAIESAVRQKSVTSLQGNDATDSEEKGCKKSSTLKNVADNILWSLSAESGNYKEGSVVRSISTKYSQCDENSVCSVSSEENVNCSEALTSHTKDKEPNVFTSINSHDSDDSITEPPLELPVFENNHIECLKSLLNQESVNRVVDLPYGRFMCKNCGKHFDSLDILDEHRVIHKTYHSRTCDQCGRTFSYSFGLRLHLEQSHGIQPTKKKTPVQISSIQHELLGQKPPIDQLLRKDSEATRKHNQYSQSRIQHQYENKFTAANQVQGLPFDAAVDQLQISGQPARQDQDQPASIKNVKIQRNSIDSSRLITDDFSTGRFSNVTLGRALQLRMCSHCDGGFTCLNHLLHHQRTHMASIQCSNSVNTLSERVESVDKDLLNETKNQTEKVCYGETHKKDVVLKTSTIHKGKRVRPKRKRRRSNCFIFRRQDTIKRRPIRPVETNPKESDGLNLTGLNVNKCKQGKPPKNGIESSDESAFILVCALCNEEFCSGALFNSHKGIHHNQLTFACLPGNEVQQDGNHLVNRDDSVTLDNINIQHKPGRSRKNNLLSATVSQRSFECPRCSEVFKSHFLLKSHKLVNHDNGSKVFDRHNRVRTGKNHLLLSGPSSFVWPICGKTDATQTLQAKKNA